MASTGTLLHPFSPSQAPVTSSASVFMTGLPDDVSGGSNLAMILSALCIAVTIMGIMAFCVWMCGCSPEDVIRGRQSSPSPRRDNNNNSNSTSSGKTAQGGMSKQAIDKLPSLSYSCLVIQRRSPDLGCCSVCLAEFTSEDHSIRVMPGCGHCFHSECISMWLFTHSSCPMCRQSLLPPGRSCKKCSKLHLEAPPSRISPPLIASSSVQLQEVAIEVPPDAP